jgi:hypothetical protein
MAQTLFTVTQKISDLRLRPATINFGLYQRRLFQQPDDLAPHELIEIILAYRAIGTPRKCR